jgi:hypothetical protein
MTFDLEVIRNSRMTMNANKLYRMMQNISTHNIDLFVREVIQNSVDAALPKQHPVIHFRNGRFDVQDLARMIPDLDWSGFESEENEKSFMVVKDTNCIGLVGDYDDSYDKSKGTRPRNLYNLVYDVMNPRENLGSGGSWGIGKTVYFRFGSGMVFYYSRIRTDDGGYESRLVGTLANKDDGTEKARWLKRHGIHTGIAFFGRRDPGREEKTIPVTDENQISDFLDIFDIEPYEDGQTGTTVIIPFIDEITLLDSRHYGKEETKPYWFSDLGSYIKESVTRWYFPRIRNKHYPGNHFTCYVNGEEVHPDSFSPLFTNLRAMYDVAIKHRDPNEPGMNVKAILMRGVSGSVGTFVWKVLDRKQLQMEPPYNEPSPYVSVDKPQDDEESNPAIVLYTRKPGMIISYEVGRSDWVESNLELDSDQYLVGIFVLKSDVEIDGRHLEEYFRKSEMSDHSRWSDHEDQGFKAWSNLKPLARIMKENFSRKDSDDDIVMPGRLAGRLGAMLLPPEHFGRRSGVRNPSPGPKGDSGSKRRGYGFSINGDVNHTGDTMTISGSLVLFPGKEKTFLDLKVALPHGSIGVHQWERQGNQFPACLKSVIATSKKIGKKACHGTHFVKITTDDDGPSFVVDARVEVSFERTSSGCVHRVWFKNLVDERHELDIYLSFKVLDRAFELDLHPGMKEGGTDE